MPFGSSFENTKQLNAALNCSPHGPCAIPPKQGQSQFISPVSSLKAPSCEASCSLSSKVSGSVDSIGGVGSDEAFWRFALTDSRVGREVSSEGELGGGTATVGLLVLESRSRLLGGRTWRFFGEKGAVVVKVYHSDCQPQSRRLVLPAS